MVAQHSANALKNWKSLWRAPFLKLWWRHSLTIRNRNELKWKWNAHKCSNMLIASFKLEYTSAANTTLVYPQLKQHNKIVNSFGADCFLYFHLVDERGCLAKCAFLCVCVILSGFTYLPKGVFKQVFNSNLNDK